MIRKLKIPNRFRNKVGADSLSISGFKKGIIGETLEHTQQWKSHIQYILGGGILQPDDVFLDIGANVGCHTVFASKFVKEVIAIEPNKETFKHLLKTIELNKCDNVTCHNIGLWDQDEIRLFCHTPLQLGQSHFTSVDYHHEGIGPAGYSIKYDVEVKRLDNLILPHVDVVKIDVEGVEKFVLRGGARLFDKCPVLFIKLNGLACHTNTGKNIKGILNQIMSFGYENREIFYSCKKNTNYKIITPPHKNSSLIWKKTDFNGLIKILSVGHSIDAIFMPPGKSININKRI